LIEKTPASRRKKFSRLTLMRLRELREFGKSCVPQRHGGFEELKQ